VLGNGEAAYPQSAREARTVTAERGWDVRGEIDAKYPAGAGPAISVGYNKKVSVVQEVNEVEVRRAARGWDLIIPRVLRADGILPAVSIGLFEQEFGASVPVTGAGTFLTLHVGKSQLV
jgi:hypothetical protein